MKIQTQTDISPIVQHIEHLTLTELRILIVMFHHGTYLEPQVLERKTGACRKSINKAIKSENVRAILKQMKQKNETTRLLLKLTQQLQETDSVF